MPYILGQSTLVTGMGPGITSISLSIQPQIQRLYQLGTTVPFSKNIITQKSLSVVRYGGTGITYDLDPSVGCFESSFLTVSIVNPGCTSPFFDEDEWFLTGYSYSKGEPLSVGSETYSLITRPLVQGTDPFIPRFLRGVAEGSRTNLGSGADTGVVFVTGATITEGQTFESSAGSPGIGQSQTIEYSEVIRVGNGTLKSDGKVGSAQVSIPLTPVYI